MKLNMEVEKKERNGSNNSRAPFPELLVLPALVMVKKDGAFGDAKSDNGIFFFGI